MNEKSTPVPAESSLLISLNADCQAAAALGIINSRRKIRANCLILFEHQRGHTWSTVSSFTALSSREMRRNWRRRGNGQSRWSGAWSPKERLWEMGLFSLVKGRLREDVIVT